MSRKASKKLKFAASILSTNYTRLAETIRELSGLVDSIHLDIMDGHFVQNLTFGPKMLSDLRAVSNIRFDAHLMISNPDKHVLEYVDAGANSVSFHIEAARDIDLTINSVRNAGCEVGLAISPHTHYDEIEPYLDEIDKVIIMSVHPGLGGQKFMNDVIPKIISIINYRDKLRRNFLKDFEVCIDGGVSDKNIFSIKDTGVDEVVIGSYLFQGNIHENLNRLYELIL